MPIIGEGEAEPNDTYVEQLTASARAAVEEAVRRGVADPKRVAVGGHSYGTRKIMLLFCVSRFAYDFIRRDSSVELFSLHWQSP